MVEFCGVGEGFHGVFWLIFVGFVFCRLEMIFVGYFGCFMLCKLVILMGCFDNDGDGTDRDNCS